MAAGSEACWHGQVWRLWVVLRVGTGISEGGLGAAVLIMMTHFQVPQLEADKDEIGKDVAVVQRGEQCCVSGFISITAAAPRAGGDH